MSVSSSDRIAAGNGGRIRCGRLLLVPALFAATPALAGPPFLTDDPEPTETGHWEIYAPLVEAEGRGSDIAAATGAEFNYGAASGVQLTVAVPYAWQHGTSGWHGGLGDVEASMKLRLVNDEAAGFQLAVFPGLTLPTARSGFGAGRVTGFLPVWAQKDMGAWSVFGGGGYALNPGPGNRDYWSGGIAVTRQLGPVTLGVEADRQGADTVGGSGSTSLGVGVIVPLKPPFRLLASGGPTIEDGSHHTGYHAFAALGLDF